MLNETDQMSATIDELQQLTKFHSNSKLFTAIYDTSWYFNNGLFYHITYDINDIESPAKLISCIFLQDNITIDDDFMIFPDSIGNVWFSFEVSGSTKCLYLSEVRYCKKLDTKHIFLGMLNRKDLAY